MLRLGESIRRCGIALLLLLSLCPLQKAHAVIGSMDTVPAATLLYPYFEVDLGNANGKSTVLSLHNSSATAILSHVTIWSNAGVPVFNFNIYLTGYDAQSFNMRDVLNGSLPQTGSAGQDPLDTISPHGMLSQDINFASCTGQLPYGTVNSLIVADLQKMLTGQASTFKYPTQCVGTNLGDNIARGYITIDTVDNCTLRMPSDPGYFGAGGTGDATNQNVMLGEYFLVNPAQNVLISNNATSIEASPGVSDTGTQPADPATTTSGRYTFYGRLVNWTAVDNREPLATTWTVQGDTGNGSAIIWRDPKTHPNSFSCATGQPAYAPLGQEGYVFFDRSGLPTTPSSPAPFAPVATQIVPLNNAAMLLPARKMGFLYLDMNTTVAAAGSNPPVDPAASQSLIVVLNGNKNQPKFSSGVFATPTDSATAAVHFIP